jgi:hypothetical protein
LLPNGPTSRELLEQERGIVCPDSAPSILAHHEEFGDVVRLPCKDQGKACQCAIDPEQEGLTI